MTTAVRRWLPWLLIVSCRGEPNVSLFLDSFAAESIVWVVSRDSGTIEVIASDDVSKLRLRVGEDDRVDGVLYRETLRELGLTPGPIPLLTENTRSLPRGEKMVRFDRDRRVFDAIERSDSVEAVRIAAIDVEACIADGRCLDETASFCIEPCDPDEPAEPASPRDPIAPDPIREPPTCPLEHWTRMLIDSVTSCVPERPTTLSCSPAEAQFFGGSCRRVGTPCPGAFDPLASGVFVRAGANGDGSRTNPVGSLDAALALVAGPSTVIHVGEGVYDAGLISGAEVRGACAESTVLRGNITLENGASLTNVHVEGELRISGDAEHVLDEVWIESSTGVAIVVEAAARARMSDVFIDAAGTGIEVYGELSAREVSVDAGGDAFVSMGSVSTSSLTFVRGRAREEAMMFFAASGGRLNATHVESIDHSYAARTLEGGVLSLEDVRADGVVGLRSDGGEIRATNIALWSDGQGIETRGSALHDLDGVWIESPVGLQVAGATLAMRNARIFSSAAIADVRDGQLELTDSHARHEVASSFVVEASNCTIDRFRVLGPGSWLVSSSSMAMNDVDVEGVDTLGFVGRNEIAIERARFDSIGSLSISDLVGRFSIANVSAVDLDMPLIIASRGGAIEARNVAVENGAFASVGCGAPTVPTSLLAADVTIRGTPTPALCLGNGAAHRLERFSFENVGIAVSFLGEVASSSTTRGMDMTIRRAAFEAFNLSGRTNAHFERIAVSESGRMIDAQRELGAIDLGRGAAAKFEDIAVTSSGNGPRVAAINLAPASRFEMRRFRLEDNSVGLAVTDNFADVTNTSLLIANGTITSNELGVQIPPGYETLTELARRVAFIDNGVDIEVR